MLFQTKLVSGSFLIKTTLPIIFDVFTTFLIFYSLFLIVNESSSVLLLLLLSLVILIQANGYEVTNERGGNKIE